MRKDIVRLLLFAVLMLPSCEHYKMQKRIAAFEAEMEEYRAQTDNVACALCMCATMRLHTRSNGA